MPKKSIKMMYDGTTSRWIPTTDYDVKGCSKVVDYQMNAGSITNGDLDFGVLLLWDLVLLFQ